MNRLHQGVDETLKYIERLITIHNNRIRPSGLDELTEKQKNLYYAIKAIAERNINHFVTRQQIVEAYQNNQGQLNMLPTNFCYNLVNVGPDIETKYLISINRGKFKFLNFNWNAENPIIITWTPIGNAVPQVLRGETIEVGTYYKDKYRWSFSQLMNFL